MGVMVTCFVIGVLLSLQFLVYGVHWTAGKVVQGGRAVGRTMSLSSGDTLSTTLPGRKS